MTMWSHHVTSSVTVRTWALQKSISNQISGAAMAPKKTDNAKKRTADARAKHFLVYRF